MHRLMIPFIVVPDPDEYKAEVGRPEPARPQPTEQPVPQPSRHAERLIESMKCRVLSRWDELGATRRDNLIRSYGAALAVIAGLPERTKRDGVRINNRKFGEILKDAGHTVPSTGATRP